MSTDDSDSSTASTDRVRDFRERLVDAGTIVAQADGRRRDLFPVAIGRKEGLALLDWVRKEDARGTLESGLGFAVSTLFICEGLLANGANGRHIAADPYQFVGLRTHATTYAGVGLQVLEEAGVRDLVEFYNEESQTLFPRLLAEDRGDFDLAFIDGNHRFEAVFLDLIFCGSAAEGAWRRLRGRCSVPRTGALGQVLYREPRVEDRGRWN